VNLDGKITDRLNTTAGLVITGNRQQPLSLGNTDPFSLLAPIGQDGQVLRNSFRAGNILQLDLALAKSFAVATEQRLILRAHIFNLLDRANFGVPVRYLGAVGFGQPFATVTPARRIQIGLKYVF
jgi:hypothetical protein